MKLHIKNIRNASCMKWLSMQLEELDIVYAKSFELGEFILSADTPHEKISAFKTRIETKGFDIILDRKSILSEKVKYVVYKMLDAEELPSGNYSAYISSVMHFNYTYLANVFSETQGLTIEHFIINIKIEKAKRLLADSDSSIGQVADALHYSSIGHLSNQFKKVTGLSPSEYRKTLHKRMVEEK